MLIKTLGTRRAGDPAILRSKAISRVPGGGPSCGSRWKEPAAPGVTSRKPQAETNSRTEGREGSRPQRAALPSLNRASG